MKKIIVALSAICVVQVMLIVSCVLARTWTDSTGKYQVQADFVKFENGQVFLKTQDGKTLAIPMSKLSTADQSWVRDELRRRRDGGGSTNSTPGSSSGSGSSSGEWAQWRGPNRDGISSETGLLASWDNDGPPVAWSTRGAGRGYSSVSVSGGRIFTMGNRRGGEELIAFNAQDGEFLWSAPVGQGKDCNCTPTVDGNLVFGLGRNGDLVCVDAESGRVIWKKNFGSDYRGRMMSGWGYSESPLVDGDRLICTPGSDDAILAALNKRTGQTIWQTRMPSSGGAGYASPVISNAGGIKQYVTLVGRGLIGVAADDGRLLWHYQRIANGTANVPTPIVKGDYVFGSSGYGDGGSALLELRKSGNSIQAREVYYKSSKELQNHHGGMVLIGDHIFMGHGHNNGFPVCVDMRTGRAAWGPERGPGGNSAAITAADGHLYFRYEDGTMALIEANPRQYKLKGSFRIKSVNGKSWPHPVIADKKLYLRDQDELHCYDIAAR